MPTYLKRAAPPNPADRTDLAETVARLLAALQDGGEATARDMGRRFDGWEGEIVVPRDRIARAHDALSDTTKADIRYAHDNIRRFAEAQRATLTDMEVEVTPGLLAGQRQIPVEAAGCYVPGGRYSHVASALMTVTTARVAGVGHVTACSPPRGESGIPDAILYALDIAGADAVLCLGGVQGVAAMARGLFGLPAAAVLAGPGNAFVAEAKRQLFGEVGIDMVAGPTDVLILADRTADWEVVAADLVGQAEHGPTSPTWLVTDHRALAETVLARVPTLIAALPEPNRASAAAAWESRGEVILCGSREEMAAVSDTYAPEHLEVHAADLDWWLGRLRSYGSLFLGADTTVAHGDKAAGPNHVLPTGRAARYTGGLSVQKFTRTVTWQRAVGDDARARAGRSRLAEISARLSRLEGMEGHARTADLRATSHATPAPVTEPDRI